MAHTRPRMRPPPVGKTTFQSGLRAESVEVLGSTTTGSLVIEGGMGTNLTFTGNMTASSGTLHIKEEEPKSYVCPRHGKIGTSVITIHDNPPLCWDCVHDKLKSIGVLTAIESE